MAVSTHTKEGEAKILGKNPNFYTFLAKKFIAN